MDTAQILWGVLFSSIGFGFFLFSIISAFPNTLFRLSIAQHETYAHRSDRQGDKDRASTTRTMVRTTMQF